MDKKHELVSALKQLCSELGRIPSRDEFIQLPGISRRQIVNTFGGFTQLLHAAGITKQEKKDSNKKRIHEFFSNGVEEILDKTTDFNNKQKHKFKKYPKILVVPDIHAPWWNLDAVSRSIDLARVWQPEIIIQLGDFYDFLSWGKFPNSKLTIKPDDELSQARKCFELFWSEMKKAAPKADLHQMIGNHSLRPMKRVLESNCPELEAFFNFKPIFEYEGVTTHHDPRTPLIIEDIAFMHGWLSGRGKHREALGMNVVHGHTHDLYLHWDKSRHNKLMFEAGAGFLGDPGAKALSYTAVKELKWQLGCVCIEFGPFLVPLG